ncbi:HlyD family secretion protein [Stutzerimonas azotifigens]|uniref:HlyD family secretion protein n=1 Tax=Stutzerimonas azotifigens TaxID=291995 RepID=UPI000410627C|nr:HlyD family efflux transporter periplasmic adaptor subunit [Stutzerimonas azotifigens]
MKDALRRRLVPVGALALLLLAGAWLWHELRPSGFGENIASGNGRIEATEVDVATKLGGRIASIDVSEGAFVTSGQVLGRMDTQVLEAELAQARAQLRQAENGRLTAQAQVGLRESEKATAEAVVQQRRAELDAAEKRYARTRILVERQAVSRQTLDDDLAARESARAALSAARAQVSSAEAGIAAARSQVIEAESAIEAAQAGVARLQAEIDDSLLKATRSGRVQYRIAEPGEVLGAGGKVLNLVDLTDVYMTFFLPERQAGRVALGTEVRLVLDAVPQYVIPARVSYVASVAQFTPKTVETESEREKLMFRVRARIAPELLERHLEQVKTGVPGMAYLRLDERTPWPEQLEIRLP